MKVSEMILFGMFLFTAFSWSKQVKENDILKGRINDCINIMKDQSVLLDSLNSENKRYDEVFMKLYNKQRKNNDR